MSECLLASLTNPDAVHSFLVVLPGKAAAHEAAMYAAQSLLCTNRGKNHAPCDSCEACKKVMANAHPDVQVYDGAELKADEVRDLRADTVNCPHEADRKIYILEDFQKLNVTCQNVLLKTLEEPPRDVYFILTSPSRSRILPTVLSRVCRLTSPMTDTAYYEKIARDALPRTASAYTAHHLAVYYEAYELTDTSRVPPKVVEEAFEACYDCFFRDVKDVYLRFPLKKTSDDEESKKDKSTALSDMCKPLEVWLQVFMLVSENIAAYIMSGGQTNSGLCDEEFRKGCMRYSAKRALEMYGVFSRAYARYAAGGANVSVLAAYLAQNM